MFDLSIPTRGMRKNWGVRMVYMNATKINSVRKA